MKIFNGKSVLVLFLLGFVALHTLILWRVHDSILRGYGDFASFYTAGKILQRGQGARLYERTLQWKIQQEFAPTVTIRSGPLPYIRPAFEALLFLPLANFGYPVGYALWTAVKLLALFTIPFVVPVETGGAKPMRYAALEILACLAFFPIAFDLIQGQDSILLLLLLALAFTSLQRGAEGRAGVFLGLGLFKFHLVIPIFCIFLLRRKTRIIRGFLATAVILLLLSGLLVGWSGMLAYPRYLWDLNRNPGLLGIKSRSMPNLRGLISPLLPLGAIPTTVHWMLVIVVLLGIVITAKLWRVDRESRALAAGFSLSVVTTILTSYYANSYDLTLLMLPVLILGRRFVQASEIDGAPRLLFLVATAALMFSPLYWVLVLRFDQFYWVALVLLLLAVSLAWTVTIWQSRSEGHSAGI
jgi:hypothetical protein